MAINPETTPKNLTERKFRSYWEQTDKSFNERQEVIISPPSQHRPAAVRPAPTSSPASLRHEINGDETCSA
jgi:hypothetical protein